MKTLSKLLITVFLILPVTSLEAAKRLTKAEQERMFRYGWSTDATHIFEGTVVAVQFDDDPSQPSPHVEVLVTTTSTQRGDPGNHLVRIIIESELNALDWSNGSNRVGETGIWFVHRLQRHDGGESRAHLLRYLSTYEISEDPQYFSGLMEYVVEGTIDQAIPKNIMNLVSLNRDPNTRAAMSFTLRFDRSGTLSGLEVLERSDNPLFNQHVYDMVLQVHRRIRIPGNLQETSIEIERSHF